ncbi:uncharacterized protein LOC135613223 [Musa acuminata AAA Group]|uniref:uncharacterized protein LOC135613223 n=1 Tax=Musa acuminata AAA Group TaxID=214697 RepID=UPI0031D772EA
MAAAASDFMGVLQILWEALHLPVKAGTLFLYLLLLTLLSSSLLFLSAYSISPLVLDLVSKLSPLFRNPIGPEPPNLFHEIEKDLRDIASLTSGVAFVFFFVSLFLIVATMYTFAMAYTNRSLSPKQLLLRVGRRWYQTLVTRLYVVLLTLGLALLSSLVIGTLMLVSRVPTVATAGVVAVLLYLYLSTRWCTSLVITVVEETWGIGALSWSVELFIGNKKKGTILTLILKVVETAIFGAFGLALASPGPPRPPEAQMKLWCIVAAATAVWEIYAMAVYTVFYYECRKSHGLEEVMTVKGEYIYTGFPAAVAVKVDEIY